MHNTFALILVPSQFLLLFFFCAFWHFNMNPLWFFNISESVAFFIRLPYNCFNITTWCRHFHLIHSPPLPPKKQCILSPGHRLPEGQSSVPTVAGIRRVSCDGSSSPWLWACWWCVVGVWLTFWTSSESMIGATNSQRGGPSLKMLGTLDLWSFRLSKGCHSILVAPVVG